MIANLYTRQPGLEYRQAFNLAAAKLNQADGPALAVLSCSMHAVELLKRCPRLFDVAGTGNFNAADFILSSKGWAWGAMRAVTLAEGTAGYTAILWAEPEHSQARHMAKLLRLLAVREAELVVITSGPLRGFLPAWQSHPFPAEKPISTGKVTRILRTERWQIEGKLAFHGPRSILWSYLARIAQILGRPDLADRSTFAAREHYMEPGWTWLMSPLALIRARAM